MNNITPNLLYIQDTCSVYAVTAGGQVLLIDCGTDMTPTAETFVGRKLEKILLTHFHRDQCSSASAWQRSGAKIVVPFGERQFLEESDLRRASYDIYDNYDFATEVLVASVRGPVHIVEAARIGADICTCPPKVIEMLFNHPLTDIGLRKFLADWEKAQVLKA